MCSCFKESSGCAPGTTPNTLRFRNKLGAGHVLNVHCSSNRGESKDRQYVLFNAEYSFPVEEKGQGRIVWRCELNDPKSRTRIMIWRAYRGAANVRCGEIREYIAELKGGTIELKPTHSSAVETTLAPMAVEKSMTTITAASVPNDSSGLSGAEQTCGAVRSGLSCAEQAV
ncbi:Plant self-incompatibility S1 protein [Raphanus sativus]|nr:Plant self-incompatibility S1 protein [Raphanus sativus]